MHTVLLYSEKKTYRSYSIKLRSTDNLQCIVRKVLNSDVDGILNLLKIVHIQMNLIEIAGKKKKKNNKFTQKGGMVAQCWEAWWLSGGGMVAQW